MASYTVVRDPPVSLAPPAQLEPANSTDNSSVEWASAPAELSGQVQAALIVLYTLTTTLSVGGNIVVIIVFTFGKRSRTDLRGFLINLACADLIMALFCMPFTFTKVMLDDWIFSEPMCPIVLYMQTVSVTASVCTNMAIGIDRFWVVTFPLRSRITKSRSKIVIAFIWCVACGLSSIQLVVGRAVRTPYSPGLYRTDCQEIWWEPAETWRRAYTFFILVLTYLLPLGILSLTYSIVAVKLWQRTAPGNADHVRDSQQLRSKRKVIKMLVIVVVLFGVCWLPLHVFILVLDLHAYLLNNATLFKMFVAFYYTAHWLAMSNSFVNPIIYGFLNDSFRNDLKRLFRRWCPCFKVCPCLSSEALTRDSTIVIKDCSVADYGRAEQRFSSSNGHGHTARTSSENRKHFSVKLNGRNGKCEAELNPTVTTTLLPKATPNLRRSQVTL